MRGLHPTKSSRSAKPCQAIDCRKSEIVVALRNDHRRASPMRKSRPLGASRAVAPEKILLQFIPNNPLISLDSDERIQGNQRKSNAKKFGFHSEIEGLQENPN